jgi:transcription initiation factor TFIID subunit TAF12
MAPLVGPRIADLVKSIDPNYGIEPDAEEQVLQLADDFLDKVTKQAIRLAHHRGSKTLDVRDFQIVLAKNFGIVVPGLGLPAVRPIKGASVASKPSSSGGSKFSSTKRNASAASMGESSGNGHVRKKANLGGSQGGTGANGGSSAPIL